MNKNISTPAQTQIDIAARPISKADRHIQARNTSRQHWHAYEASGVPASQSSQALDIITKQGPINARQVCKLLGLELSTGHRAINTLLKMQPSPIRIFKRDKCPVTGVRVQFYVNADYIDPSPTNK